MLRNVVLTLLLAVSLLVIAWPPRDPGEGSQAYRECVKNAIATPMGCERLVGR